VGFAGISICDCAVNNSPEPAPAGAGSFVIAVDNELPPWLNFGRSNATRMSQNPFRLLLHVPVPWVFILAYLCGVALEFIFPGSFHSPETNRAGSILGGILLATGVAIAAWGWLIFFKARTTTVPGRASNKLVTWGPYRFSRNPMYVGLGLAYLGEAGLLHQLWPVIFLPPTICYLNWIVIPVEEARLKEVFASEYQAYCAKVRRWV
jgi:protein-S-isoprenylcysteine O-methyltransferase Ste14